MPAYVRPTGWNQSGADTEHYYDSWRHVSSSGDVMSDSVAMRWTAAYLYLTEGFWTLIDWSFGARLLLATNVFLVVGFTALGDIVQQRQRIFRELLSSHNWMRTRNQAVAASPIGKQRSLQAPCFLSIFWFVKC